MVCSRRHSSTQKFCEQASKLWRSLSSYGRPNEIGSEGNSIPMSERAIQKDSIHCKATSELPKYVQKSPIQAAIACIGTGLESQISSSRITILRSVEHDRRNRSSFRQCSSNFAITAGKKTAIFSSWRNLIL